MNIQRTIDSGGICTLRFDRPGSAANIFDGPTLAELEAHVAFLEAPGAAKGVVITSGKPKIFIAGADLNAMGGKADAASLGAMVETGQRIFTRLSRLPIPSVAAIHGACLGGGCELALACDWRVASDDRATKIGLPETQLGILPAWGGSVRLPRLIGLPAALGIILPGKQLAAQQARKVGLVDEVVHAENLGAAASRLLARGRRPAPQRGWLSRPPLDGVVAARARKELLKKTRGHYPAPLRALEVSRRALGLPLEQGLALEREAFVSLAGTETARNLLRIFFLQERAKKLSVPEKGAPVRRAAVIGAGVMGAGIAQWIAARGLPVLLKDINAEAVAKGMRSAEKIFSDGARRRAFSAVDARAGLDRITPVHEDVSLRNVDLVVEAAVEQLELKRRIFQQLEPLAGPETVLATNTSALSIDSIASGLSHPERVLGLHFFNPVHRMQLVEIVRGPRTSPAALATALQFVKAIGKLPVIARDSPGFVVNRILLPYMVEALWLFQEGHGIEDIDNAMLDFGMPMGPLRLADEVGIDVARHVAADLQQRLPSAVPVPETLGKVIERKLLGRKSGRGFYVFSGKREEPNPEVLALRPAPAGARSDASTLVDRMVLVMVNEAARCLDERVVDAPEDIDFAMIMGTGWAPFRGGPLRYADARGIEPVVRRLGELAASKAPYFAPCERLARMARDGQTFYASKT